MLAQVERRSGEEGIQQEKIGSTGGPPGKAPLVVGVEGNIGVGKSSLLRELGVRNPSWLLILEPVEKWAAMLGATHENPKELSVGLQRLVCRVMVDRLPEPEQIRNVPVILMERSLEASQHVFTQLAYEQGHINARDREDLNHMFEKSRLNVDRKLSPGLVLYLSTCPEKALERVRGRGRPCERSLSLSFLSHLHHLHVNWLLKGRPQAPPAPVHSLDTAECTLSEACAKAEELIKHAIAALP